MKFNNIIISLFLLYSTHSLAITKQFNISSFIDKKNILGYNIVRFELSPSNTTLNYNERLKKFSDKTLKLIINTDIPKSDTYINKYNLTLKTNKSNCYDSKNEILAYKDNLVNIFIDNSTYPLIIDNKVTLLAFNKINSTKNSEHSIKLQFNEINNKNVQYCEGAISLLFGYDL